MAGHSKFKKIKHKKEAADNKRSKDFARVSREITIAARLGGGDPKSNPRLRMAMQSAKDINFPKTKVEDAIKKGVNPNEGEILEEFRYEGFGPSGIAVIVDTISTARQKIFDKALVNKAFLSHGGSLGEEGCVQYLFQRLGLITFPATVRAEDDMLLLAVDHGAEDCQRVDDQYEILCSFERVHTVKEELERALGAAGGAKPIWKPSSTVVLDHKQTRAAVALLDSLVELETVQDVWSNLDIPEDFDPEAAAA